MRTITSWEFTLPELLPLDINIRTDVEELLASTKSSSEKEIQTEILSKKYHPWVLDYEDGTAPGQVFRTEACMWHIDRQDNRTHTALFASSTPPSFAACEMTVYEGMEEMFEEHGLSGVLDKMYRVFGRNWLKIAADESSKNRYKQRIARLVTVTGLSVLEARPYEAAYGSLSTTLHRGNLRKELAPESRVIGIVNTHEADGKGIII